MWRHLLIAGRFLTRLPLPDRGPVSGPELGRAAIFFPLVGLVVGLLVWGAAHLSDMGIPTDLAAALVLTAWVWLTGALHLDGLADMADAWVGGLNDRQRTLDIMKDPSAGPMGVVTLVLVLLCKWAAIAVLIAEGGTTSLVWIPALARTQLLLVFLHTPYARNQGLGAEFIVHLPRRLAWVAIMVTLAGLFLFGFAPLPAVGVAGVLFLLWRRVVMLRLGGFSGDTAGALVELTETAALVTAALSL